ncbi:MAG: LysM peptidoglycan-binding domain-containing protein, partial [Anaerolineales bacterium]|nr:LysM peptidoglycan-binding domain-containing protein [Anaerolineales bacterium]
MRNRKLLYIFARMIMFTLVAAFPVGFASGQDQPLPGPVYIVQAGDTLWAISQRFGVDIDELMLVNGIDDAGQLNAEQQLIIPGLEGIQGTLATQEIPYGETLRSLSRRYQIPEHMLARLNHFASPSELYVGYDLVIPESDMGNAGYERLMIAPGQSPLELAVLHGMHPWEIAASNLLTSTVTILPGDVLLTSSPTGDGPGALPDAIKVAQVNPLPMLQGKTGLIRVEAAAGLSLTGLFMDHQLNFFET